MQYQYITPQWLKLINIYKLSNFLNNWKQYVNVGISFSNNLFLRNIFVYENVWFSFRITIILVYKEIHWLAYNIKLFLQRDIEKFHLKQFHINEFQLYIYIYANP